MDCQHYSFTVLSEESVAMKSVLHEDFWCALIEESAFLPINTQEFDGMISKFSAPVQEKLQLYSYVSPLLSEIQTVMDEVSKWRDVIDSYDTLNDKLGYCVSILRPSYASYKPQYAIEVMEYAERMTGYASFAVVKQMFEAISDLFRQQYTAIFDRAESLTAHPILQKMPRTASSMNSVVATAYVSTIQITEAITWFQSAIINAEVAGDIRRVMFNLLTMAAITMDGGDFVHASSYLKKFEDLQHAGNAVTVRDQCYFYYIRSSLYIHEKDYHQALAWILKAHPNVEELDDATYVLIRRTTALVLHHLERYDEALEQLALYRIPPGYSSPGDTDIDYVNKMSYYMAKTGRVDEGKALLLSAIRRHGLQNHSIFQDKQTGVQSALIALAQADENFLALSVIYKLTAERSDAFLIEERKRLFSLHDERLERERLMHQRELDRRVELSRTVVSTQERTSNRIASDLHDSIGQTFAILRLRMDEIQRLLHQTGTVPSQKIEEITELVLDADKHVRSVSHELGSNTLRVLGLEAAFSELIGRMTSAQGPQIQFHIFGVDERLDLDVELCLYRSAQIALTNILKHAGAQNVSVQVIGDGREVTLMIEDDGQGFILEDVREGLGLRDLRARSELVGGTTTIDSTPGHGTTIVVTVPIYAQQEPS